MVQLEQVLGSMAVEGGERVFFGGGVVAVALHGPRGKKWVTEACTYLGSD